MPVLDSPKTKNKVCSPSRIRRILKSDHISRHYWVLPIKLPIGVRNLAFLSDLKVGESATLVALDLPESVQNHLMHMGFVPNAQVAVLRRAPAGDPTVYSIDGMEIALRHETAGAIRIRPAEAELPEDEEPSVAGEALR